MRFKCNRFFGVVHTFNLAGYLLRYIKHGANLHILIILQGKLSQCWGSGDIFRQQQRKFAGILNLNLQNLTPFPRRQRGNRERIRHCCCAVNC